MKPLNPTDFKLLLVSDLGMLPISGVRTDSNKPRQARFCELQCVCGTIFKTRCDIGKHASSCKPCSAKQAATKHGDATTRLYKLWQQIHNRCKPGNTYYENVTIDTAWKDYTVFKQWAIQAGYTETTTIDRINLTKGYTPSNCRWTTQIVQSRNTRLIYSHNKSGYRGVSFATSKNKWKASIKLNSKSTHLGYFNSALDAAKAYDTYVVTNNLEHTINGVLHEQL